MRLLILGRLILVAGVAMLVNGCHFLKSDSPSGVSLLAPENPTYCVNTHCAPLLGRPPLWRFKYLGASLKRPKTENGLVSIRVPGRWHEVRPGTPHTGVAYYRLDFSLRRPETAGRFNLLSARRVESAARIYLNGEIIGHVGRPGKNRKEEFARLHPEFLELRPGLLRKHNRLELIISNFHTRGGGLLELGLGNQKSVRREFALRLFREALLLGMLCVAAIFFFIIWLTERNDKAYLFFSLLMFLLIVRGAASNGLLEFFAPSRHWTDVRLLLETWSGISMSPAVLFWFIYHLFPLLRERPRPWSRRRDILRFYFTSFSGAYLTVGGIVLSLWFLRVFDASIYVAQLDLMLWVFIIPALFQLLILLVIAVIHGENGARAMLLGFLVFMAAALADVFTIISGAAHPLQASVGMLIFVLCLTGVLGRRLYGLNRFVLRSRDSLRENNRRLMNVVRIKDRFLLNSARAISSPLNDIVDTSVRLLDKPGAGMGSEQLRLLTRLADIGKEGLRRFKRMEYYLTRLKSNYVVLLPFSPAEFLGREIPVLEKTYRMPIALTPPPESAPVLGDPDSLRLVLHELCEDAGRRGKSARAGVELKSTSEGLILNFRVHYPSGKESMELEENFIGELGMPLLERIAEIHGGRLEMENGHQGDIAWTDWSFILRFADRESHRDPELVEKISHARFLSAAGFLRQSSREFGELLKTGALNKEQLRRMKGNAAD